MSPERSIAMMALFERGAVLLTQAHRRLVLPFKADASRESPLVAKLRQYTEPLKALRDPYAHTGGAAHWVAETGRLDQYVLHGNWPLIASIMTHHQNFAESMCDRMRNGREMAVQTVDSLIGELTATVPWDQVKAAAAMRRTNP